MRFQGESRRREKVQVENDAKNRLRAGREVRRRKSEVKRYPWKWIEHVI